MSSVLIFYLSRTSLPKFRGFPQYQTSILMLSLFEVYRDSGIKEKDDFNAFLKWGQTLLQDFNEIDRYLIPSKDILNYLSAIKELNHWSLKKDKTEMVQNYLELWQHLYPIYKAFAAKLLNSEQRLPRFNLQDSG